MAECWLRSTLITTPDKPNKGELAFICDKANCPKGLNKKPRRQRVEIPPGEAGRHATMDPDGEIRRMTPDERADCRRMQNAPYN